MSWPDYLDSMKANSAGAIVECAIYGKEGGVPWAVSAGIQRNPPTQEELTQIIHSIHTLHSDDKHESSTVMGTGVRFQGKKYISIRCAPGTEECNIVGMKGQDGICIAQISQAILIALFSGGNTNGGNANKGITSTQKYLFESGF